MILSSRGRGRLGSGCLDFVCLLGEGEALRCLCFLDSLDLSRSLEGR